MLLLSYSAAQIIIDFLLPVALQRRRSGERPLTVGLCGAQGSGKSTIASLVCDALRNAGLSCALLSLDDIYLAREEREALACDVHPLFRTRGVPGTHDLPLGQAVLNALAEGSAVRLPRFDKARDAPLPTELWPYVDGPVDVVFFEGWCVGARAEPDGALTDPVNRLEAEEDREGHWRRYVNAMLADPYSFLFRQIDRLIFLAAPSFDVVARWRSEQEHALRARLAAEGRDDEHTMNDAMIERFVLHYERLTRHMLQEMPARADLTIQLNAERRVVGQCLKGEVRS